jgi:beta-glucosidase
VAFPFGYGLSYTTFEYDHMTLSQTEMQYGDELTVTATIRNTGDVDGAEVVQLYVSDIQQTVFRPEKELKGFVKVFLKAGHEKQVTFNLDARSFAIYDTGEKSWMVPGGIYAILIASSSTDVRLQQTVLYHGATRKIVPSDSQGWYASLSSKVTEADFIKLLGRPIEPPKKSRKGEYTMSSSLGDMEGNYIIRRVIRYIEKMVAKSFGGVDYSNPNFRMAMESATNMPLKTLVMMSPDGMPAHVAQGLVYLANGQLSKSIGAFLKKG